MKKGHRIPAMVLALLFSLSSLWVFRVSAGNSNIIVDDASFAKKLDNAVWCNPEGDVKAENGAIVFPKESTKYTRLIAKSAAYADVSREELLELACTIQFQSLPKGKAVSIALGLDSIESYSGEEGSVEIAFRNDGGIHMTVNEYQGKEPTALSSSKSIGVAVGSAAKVQMVCYKDGKLTVKVGGRSVFEGKCSVSCEGRFGFLQTGDCEVRITQLKAVSYRSDNPENCDITEDFEDGSINTALLTSKMMYSSNNYPSGLDVQEYNGSGVLMFRNVGLGYIGTKYQYSNFEITFDVPYLCRKTVTDPKDGSVTPRSEWFGISYGSEVSEFESYGFTDAYDLVYFTPASVPCTLAGGGKQLLSTPAPGYVFFDPEETRGFSVRMSVIDAEVTVAMKWFGEKEFHTLAQFPTNDGTTPLGHVHLWSYGPGNFAIDNLKIINKDHQAKLIEVKEKSGKVVVPADYAYKQEKAVYRPAGANTGQKGFRWYLIIPAAVGAAVLISAGGALLGIIKRKKEVLTDEEK